MRYVKTLKDRGVHREGYFRPFEVERTKVAATFGNRDGLNLTGWKLILPPVPPGTTRIFEIHGTLICTKSSNRAVAGRKNPFCGATNGVQTGQTVPFRELRPLDASKLVDGTANLLLRLPKSILLSNVYSDTVYLSLQIN